ncbi:hypothetical protein GW17_00054045 [Ensete ventricosum]|nr:hypothetical protein GW17_00054045 [Ensete ventricosum]
MSAAVRCDFVAAGGVGCSEGAAEIGRRRGRGVNDYCRGGQQRYGARDRYWTFERLSNQTENWSEKQLLGTFIEGLKPEIRGEVKVRQLYNREHHCKKGRLLMIELAEDEDNETYEEALEPKEEAMEEESQPANYAVHALAGYSNPQMMKGGGLLKQQLIIVLIDMGSTNNFLNSKVAVHLVLQIEGCNKFDVKVANDRIFNCDQRCPRVKHSSKTKKW